MRVLLTIMTVLCSLLLISGSADARPKKRTHTSPQHAVQSDCGFFFCPDIRPQGATAVRGPAHTRRQAYGTNVTYLAHPPGCPRRAFCGCGASYKIYGRQIRSLWPTSNWFKFPRAIASHMKAAVRRGHVFVLDRPTSRGTWMVWDYNSGGHRSRYHERSIRGYTIVDPMGGKYASAIMGRS